MSACRDRAHRDYWHVVVRKANYSAFNGYRWTPSDYSLVRCILCPRNWRTRAAYADELTSFTLSTEEREKDLQRELQSEGLRKPKGRT